MLAFALTAVSFAYVIASLLAWTLVWARQCPPILPSREDRLILRTGGLAWPYVLWLRRECL